MSKGEGEPSYTLYVPFWTPHNSRFTLAALIPHLQSAIGARSVVDSVEGRGKQILRIQGFITHEAAKTAFERIRSVARLLSLESNTAIAVDGEVTDPDASNCGLLEGWNWDGSTWTADPQTGRVQIDGIANVLVPTIVPEHKRIVDAGGMVGQIVRQVRPEVVEATVARVFSHPPVNLSRSDELAVHAYMTACSQENRGLRFIGLVTCLEVMSQPKTRNDTRDAIRRRVERHKGAVADSLPPDHPHVHAPEGAIDLVYRIRNKLAHEGHWDSFTQDDVHRSMQFLTSVTRVLLKLALQP